MTSREQYVVSRVTVRGLIDKDKQHCFSPPQTHPLPLHISAAQTSSAPSHLSRHTPLSPPPLVSLFTTEPRRDGFSSSHKLHYFREGGERQTVYPLVAPCRFQEAVTTKRNGWKEPHHVDVSAARHLLAPSSWVFVEDNKQGAVNSQRQESEPKPKRGL